MTSKNTDTPTAHQGAALIRALIQKAEQLGMDKYQLATAIDITYPYLCALTNGTRPIEGVKHKKLRKIASFLGLTFVQVLMLAEIIHPQDFLKDQGEELEMSMRKAIDNMRAHHEWGGVAPLPEEWALLSPKTRVGIALLWQQVAGQSLLNQAQMVVLDKVKTEATQALQRAA